MSSRDTPEVRQARGSAAPEPRRCGGKLRLTDPPRYCTQWPRRGGTRCKFHNGTPKVGFDRKHTKTGLYSKYAVLSPRVFEQFTASLADTALLDLKPDVALLDTLLWQAAANIGTGASAAQWHAALEAWEELERSQTKEHVHAARTKLRTILRIGADEAAAREEASRLAERRTKVVKTYQQLQVDAQDLIPAKQVGVVLAIFAALMREFITEDVRRHEFSRRFLAALGPRLRPPAGTVDADDHAAAAVEPA